MKARFVFMTAAIFTLTACTNPERTTPTTPAAPGVKPPQTPPEYGAPPARHADTAINDARHPDRIPVK